MRLKFNSNLKFQEDAVLSTIDLFRGQMPAQLTFDILLRGERTGTLQKEHGIGNDLQLNHADILANLQDVQLRNGLPQSSVEKSEKFKLDFDIEMETGTGKTYVYLRTIFELNKQYGFAKFIIVVPSIAIKEGVFSFLRISSDHFRGLYDNRVYEYFIYSSDKLEQVRNFAVSDNIQIMVINIDAFRKSFEDTEKESKANVIHRENDKLNGMKPIELIQDTNPIVIIDEPQSVWSTEKAENAIRKLNPLCTLNYSATHVRKHNLIYKLDAVDAYEMGLVKQIEVTAFEAKDSHNNAYMKLLSVDNKQTPITAKLEIDVQKNEQVKRMAVQVKHGSDLYKLSGYREVYEGYIVDEIYCETGNEYVAFTSKPEILRLHEALGDIDDSVIKKLQIRKTIEEHFDKELRLNPQGIKVLSLFFIDRVANYREYDEHNNASNGKYAIWFEEAYKEVARKPKYQKLLENKSAQDAHNGYFSHDKKGAYKDSNGTTAADDDVYNTIMKEKEWLLSFDCKLRFIFSHSALREGWDNPNVFQICTLNETRSEVKKRQEIGRGMRLCVNQNGERLHGNDINTLTVMANESYESFARALQKEIEQEEGIRFGFIEEHTFANIPVKKSNGSTEYLGVKASKDVFMFFTQKGYIEDTGKVLDLLKAALSSNALEVPTELMDYKFDIADKAKKICGNLNIRNSADKRPVSLNKRVYLSNDFKELWERIKYKTTYSVEFDSNELIDKCCEEMKKVLAHISVPSVIQTTATIGMVGGVTPTETDRLAYHVASKNPFYPDIISHLQNETDLTRRTVVEILRKSGTLSFFKKNPQKYMDETAKIIRATMRLLVVDGIKYTKIGDSEFYAQELFEAKELVGYLSKNMLESERSVYDHIVYDSDNEAKFAQQCENSKRVKLYVKLPNWFVIETPLGGYNPDWAILIEDGEDKKLYFVIETKAKLGTNRPSEESKIKCGYAHFAALGNSAQFTAASDFKDFIESV